MAAAQEAAAPAAGRTEPNHGLRIFLIWLPLALAADLLLWFVYGPHMPPGRMSTSAASQQFDIRVMSVMGAPVMLFVLTFAGYSFISWRTAEGDQEDGPPIEGNTRVQISWITVTTILVLSLFGFGFYELVTPAGAGAGEGPSPIWAPGGKPLVVQVIAQQWLFTYRYPQYGGFETTALVLPVGQEVQFNVTSLDVIHSFWAYQLGVKADANPQVNNVAFTKPLHTGGVTVRCAELCGLWHGAMFDYGRVVSVPAFKSWAQATKIKMAKITKTLPAYSLVYYPNEIKGLAKFYYEAGLPGAGGGFYGNQYYPDEP
ncbi:MAG TPA: cytochrome c oxidase subunit II [Streptosporangiaceae bacterium]|nr:cytochrome c oxidase subunit II [Streptosporangiaceae bacterium]